MGEILGTLTWQEGLQVLLIIATIAGLAKFYKVIFKIDGISGTGKTAKVNRFVIGGISVVASFLGTYAAVYWLTQSVVISSLVAAFIAAAIDAFSFYSEKAFFMSFYMENIAQMVFRTFILGVALMVNYYSMVNYGTSLATHFMQKQEKKITKDVDSAIDYSNKSRIELVEDYKSKKQTIKYDWKEFVNNKTLAEIEAKKAKADTVIKRYQEAITNKKKGKTWYEKEIANLESKKIRLQGIKEDLIAKAKAKAESKRLKKIAFYDNEIKRLTDIIENKSIGKRKIISEQKNSVKKDAKEIESRVKNYVRLILVAMIIFSSILFFSSNEPLLAREKALEYLHSEAEYEEAKAKIKFERELADKRLKALRDGTLFAESTEPEQQSELVRPSFALKENEPNYVESIGEEHEAKEVDYNLELFKIASSAAIDGVHPGRWALKDLAKGYGLDVKKWTEKYQAYAKDMKERGLIAEDGKGYKIIGELNEVA